MSGIINLGGNDYEFEGQRFEMHPWCGPCPLKKNGDPKTNIPNSFWPMFKRWQDLPEEKKKETLVRRGGCVHF